MHSSKSLSLLVIAFMQGLVAAAPGFIPNGTTYGPGPTAVRPPTNHTSIRPNGSTTITSIETGTKTLTWTVNVPCTTVLGGMTSHYTTASVYTSWVPEYKTITITSPCKGWCAGPSNTPASTSPLHQQPPPPPVYNPHTSHTYRLQETCPPASTVTLYTPVTVTQTLTVTVPASHSYPVVSPHPATITPSMKPTCLPGNTCTSCAHGKCHETVCHGGYCTVVTTYSTKTFVNWNGTDVSTTHRPTGTVGTLVHW